MGTFKFVEAKADRGCVRIIVGGPSGSGKTYASIRLARGIVGEKGRIAVADTEHCKAKQYRHLTQYFHTEFDPPFTPQRYMEAIEATEEGGFDALILDNLTYAWNGEGGILEIADAAKDGSSSPYGGWGTARPLHRKLIDRILRSSLKCIICTVRSDVKWVVETNAKGKKEPKKLGVKLVQSQDVEYDFDVVWMLDRSHSAVAMTDHTELFDARRIELTETVGHELRAWLCGNDRMPLEVLPVPPPPAAPAVSPPDAGLRQSPTRKDIAEVLLDMADGDKDAARKLCREILGVSSCRELAANELAVAMEKVGEEFTRRIHK